MAMYIQIRLINNVIIYHPIRLLSSSIYLLKFPKLPIIKPEILRRHPSPAGCRPAPSCGNEIIQGSPLRAVRLEGHDDAFQAKVVARGADVIGLIAEELGNALLQRVDGFELGCGSGEVPVALGTIQKYQRRELDRSRPIIVGR